MNKYEFDFKRIEDVLYDVLGIVNPTDLMSLKMQIRESLHALSEAIDKKSVFLSSEQDNKIYRQKNALYKELDDIVTETDLDTILRKCITIRYLTLLSLEVKIRPEDTYDERAMKQNRRNEIFALSSLIKSVPSIVKLIETRDLILNYIDAKNRKLSFDGKSPKNVETQAFFQNPQLRFQVWKGDPVPVSGECGKILEEAGIYAFDMGKIEYFPDDPENYVNAPASKSLMGIIKEDEFGDIKKYCVLTEGIHSDIKPEFYKDIMFSDMLLRNAKNNFGFLGIPKKLPEDVWYGYQVAFDSEDAYTEGMLKTICSENSPNIAPSKPERSISEFKNVSDVYEIMEKKLEKASKDCFPKTTEESSLWQK